MVRRRRFGFLSLAVTIVVVARACVAADEPAIEPPANAADYYRQAAHAIAHLSDADMALIESTAEVSPLHLYGSSSPWSEQPSVRFSGSIPTNASAAEAIAHLEPALAWFRQGAATPHCDWGFDFGTGNLSNPIPHLPLVPDLVRCALFRARYRWAAGMRAEAVEDVQALKAFAAHVGAKGDGGLISLVVQFNIERIAINTLLTWLVDADTARYVSEAATEPDRPSANLAKKALLLETETVLPLARRLIDTSQLTDEQRRARYEVDLLTDVYTVGQLVRRYTEKGLLEQIERSEAHYQRVGSVLDLPVDKFERSFDRYIGELAKQRNFFSDLGLVQCPGIERVYFDVKELHVRWHMLAAAVDVVQNGPESLRSHPDPFGDGPFAYHPSDEGFRLDSELEVHGAAVSIQVGARPGKQRR